MAIDFRNFTDDIASFFGDPTEDFGARQNGDRPEEGREDAATFITNKYVENVLQGADTPFGNVIVTFNQDILKSAFMNAFNIGFDYRSESGLPIIFSNTIYTGLLGFWTSGILSFTFPPPTSIQIVSNVVTFPGSPQGLSFENFNKSHRVFAKELVQMFRKHLMTLTGITTSLVPQPTGPPIPITFPWSGYR